MAEIWRNDNVKKIMNDNPFMEKDLSFSSYQPTVHTVNCTGALSGDTPVAIADGYNAGRIIVKKMGELSIKYGDHDLPIYGAKVIKNKKFEVVGSMISPAMIYIVPKRVSLSEIVGIGFSNGITIECSPSTGFMRRNGSYLKASDMKVGDKVVQYDITIGEDHMNMDEVRVDRIEKKLSISSFGCLFVSITGNILVPKQLDDNKYQFIVVQQ